MVLYFLVVLLRDTDALELILVPLNGVLPAALLVLFVITKNEGHQLVVAVSIIEDNVVIICWRLVLRIRSPLNLLQDE